MEEPQIDLDVPYAEYPPTFENLQERIDAAFNTLAETHEGGVLVEDEDMDAARGVFTGRKAPTERVLSSPGTVVHLKALLTEYDTLVVQSAAQIRRYVTNRLLEDSANPDPRIRIRCYELLGKISDVGLFTEKSEVTLKHRPTEELEQLLRERLIKTIEAEDLGLPQAPVQNPDYEDVEALLDARVKGATT